MYIKKELDRTTTSAIDEVIQLHIRCQLIFGEHYQVYPTELLEEALEHKDPVTYITKTYPEYLV